MTLQMGAVTRPCQLLAFLVALRLSAVALPAAAVALLGSKVLGLSSEP